VTATLGHNPVTPRGFGFGGEKVWAETAIDTENTLQSTENTMQLTARSEAGALSWRVALTPINGFISFDDMQRFAPIVSKCRW
jgi:hypothetical protein